MGLGIGRGGAVHREHPPLRHQVVHDRKHALLHLPGVLRAEDHDLAILQAQGNRRPRFVVGRELSRVVDDVVGLAEAGQLLVGRPDEHRVHEESVVRPRADDADFDAIGRIPAGESVDDVESLAGVEALFCPLSVGEVDGRIQRKVDRTPPYVVLRVRVFYDPLILRRTPRLVARVRDERAALGDPRAGIVTDGVLVESRRRRVAADVADGDTVRCQVHTRHRNVESASSYPCLRIWESRKTYADRQPSTSQSARRNSRWRGARSAIVAAGWAPGKRRSPPQAAAPGRLA